MESNDAQPPSLWPSLLACAVAALGIDLGTIHRLHHADSLLYAMISLWRWTPFYWGQDRVGMLVPLLARPIANPLTNLLFQDYLNIFGGLAAFVLLARWTVRDISYPFVGLLGAAAFVAFVPVPYQAMYFVDACYGVWLSLGLAGLLLMERRGRRWTVRWGLSLVLILLAHWVNYATALTLGPLVLARAWLVREAGNPRDDGRPRARLLRLLGSETSLALMLLALGVLFGRAITGLASARVATPTSASAPHLWPDAWLALATNHWASLSPPSWPISLASAMAMGVILIALPRTRRRAARSWRVATALVVAAILAWIYTGTRLWSHLNGHTYRYLMPSAFLIQSAAWKVALGAIVPGLGKIPRRVFAGLSVSTLLLACFWTYGVPSLSGVRADIDRKFGSLTPELVDSHSTHLAGAYYRVWPAVFHANLVLHERAEGRTLWAVTGRSEATIGLWGRYPSDRVLLAIPIGDREAESRLREFRVPPLIEINRGPNVRVFRVRSPTPGPFLPD